MTSNQNKFLASQLAITFQLLLFLIILILFTTIPMTTARNARNTVAPSSDAVNKTFNNNSGRYYINDNKSISNNPTESLVIMSHGTNITSVYNSFIEFMKMFDVELPSDRKVTFTNGNGKLHTPTLVTIKLTLLLLYLLILWNCSYSKLYSVMLFNQSGFFFL